MILSKRRITRGLIRLRRCAGWSAPVLFANPRRQVFSQRGLYGRPTSRSCKLAKKTLLFCPLKCAIILTCSPPITNGSHERNSFNRRLLKWFLTGQKIKLLGAIRFSSLLSVSPPITLCIPPPLL